jgi:hypothetical protein
MWDGILTPGRRGRFGRYGNNVFAPPRKIGIRGGDWEARTARFETPVQIREGDYEIGFVGVFSYFGGRGSRFCSPRRQHKPRSAKGAEHAAQRLPHPPTVRKLHFDQSR